MQSKCETHYNARVCTQAPRYYAGAGSRSVNTVVIICLGHMNDIEII